MLTIWGEYDFVSKYNELTFISVTFIEGGLYPLVTIYSRGAIPNTDPIGNLQGSGILIKFGTEFR